MPPDNAPQRPLLSEMPELREPLIEFIALRDCIGKDLARKIIAAMDVHQLTLLEMRARDFRPANRMLDREQHHFGLPEHPREIETDYHPFSASGLAR